MKLEELMNIGINKLKDNKIDEPMAKSKILLSYVLNVPKERLIIENSRNVLTKLQNKYLYNIDKLCKHIPIQYITHNQEFMKMNFYVDENVLIPQPDTETLVEETLKIIKENMSVLDVCTGSGAIAISLAKYGRMLQIDASDISKKALDIAKRNAISNLCISITFIQSDLFKNIKGKYDIIVSNPPYIETHTLETLSEEVKHEPIIALDGGKDGLTFYRKIASTAKQYLNSRGYLCLEIGYNQKAQVIEVLRESGYLNIKCTKDLSGNNRVIICEVR